MNEQFTGLQLRNNSYRPALKLSIDQSSQCICIWSMHLCDCIAEEGKQLEHSALITATLVCFCPKQTKNLMNVASKLN